MTVRPERHMRLIRFAAGYAATLGEDGAPGRTGTRWSCAAAGEALADHLRLRRRRRKREGEGGPAVRIVCDAHTATMRSHGFAHDSETEAGAFAPLPRTAPESLENI